MSFMFNPFPYDDPNAYNQIENNGICLCGVKQGNDAVAAKLAELVKAPAIIAIDGYATAPFDTIAALFNGVKAINVSGIFKDPEVLKEMFAENLPMDKVKDPVLLYGKLFKDGYRALFDDAKFDALCKELEANTGVIVLYGNGALCDELRKYATVRIFADVTPKKAVLNIKKGGYKNFGADEEIPFKATMRRCYFVDFETAFSLRCKLLANKELDYYIACDDPSNLQLLPFETLDAVTSRALDYPIRQKPVYLEGVWGGYYVMKYRNLPDTMKNCAWVFDMIPMEVSTVIKMDGYTFEFPYYVLVAAHGEKLMGQQCLKDFHGFFPIRFNYDDTFHASGNMSIQLHPGEKFVTEENGELGRQDESYYVVVTGQGAKTYLGFNNGADVDEFVSEIKRSEIDHEPVDYQKYVYGVESKPGTQVMIPAGTIHASGQNQVILEIGSLTVGSYTYKMYDYVRKDLDGNPRPIHSYYGSLNLNHSMTEDYVLANLVNGRKGVIRQEADGCEMIVGECDQLYFSLRNLCFGDYMTDNTKTYGETGDFHVLALIDGEDVTVRSKADPSLSFKMNYLDIIVVPANMGEYELVNGKPGTKIVIHKTMLKR